MDSRELDRIMTKEFLEQKYLLEMKTTREIGLEVGCAHRPVVVRLRRYGIPTTDRPYRVTDAVRARNKRTYELSKEQGRETGRRTRFATGVPSPLKGTSKETHQGVARRAAARVGVPRPDMRGPKNPRWKGGNREVRDRNSIPYKTWRESVYKRDDWVCRDCHKRGPRLHAHHVKPWSEHPDLRYDIANGVTLCSSCHMRRHRRHTL